MFFFFSFLGTKFRSSLNTFVDPKAKRKKKKERKKKAKSWKALLIFIIPRNAKLYGRWVWECGEFNRVFLDLTVSFCISNYISFLFYFILLHLPPYFNLMSNFVLFIISKFPSCENLFYGIDVF